MTLRLVLRDVVRGVTRLSYRRGVEASSVVDTSVSFQTEFVSATFLFFGLTDLVEG